MNDEMRQIDDEMVVDEMVEMTDDVVDEMNMII